MAYSRSPDTLRKIEPHIEKLKTGESVAWDVPEGKADYWAFKVREAMFIARIYPHDFPELAKAAERLTVEVVSPTRVQARVTENTSEAVVAAPPATSTPHQGLEPYGRSLTHVGVTTAAQIINAWKQAQPSNNPLHFPESGLNHDELTALYNWARARTPRLMILKFGQALTLSIEMDEALPAAWTPERLA